MWLIDYAPSCNIFCPRFKSDISFGHISVKLEMYHELAVRLQIWECTSNYCVLHSNVATLLVTLLAAVLMRVQGTALVTVLVTYLDIVLVTVLVAICFTTLVAVLLTINSQC